MPPPTKARCLATPKGGVLRHIPLLGRGPVIRGRKYTLYSNPMYTLLPRETDTPPQISTISEIHFN